jgi:hypothetical protein
MVVALHDPWSGKDLWSRNFEDTTQVSLVEFDEVAVLEPSGKFVVLSLADGAIRFDAGTEPEPRLQQLHVIRGRDQYVAVANQVSGNALPGWGNVTTQSVAVAGRIYGFDRMTAKRLWVHEFDRHGIDLHQPANLPILTLMSSFNPPRPNSGSLEFGLTLIDKRTGQKILDERKFEEPLLFVEYAADVVQKQLELRFVKSVRRLTFTDKPLPE